MISFSSDGDYSKTFKTLAKMGGKNLYSSFKYYGAEGVRALRNATPKDSSLTANSWNYRIVQTQKGARIEWYNTNVNGRANIAILIQYGHGTRTGAYVQGRDYINPAIRPIFSKMVDAIWKEVRES